jgi:hypothetical protein
VEKRAAGPWHLAGDVEDKFDQGQVECREDQERVACRVAQVCTEDQAKV